jgi:aspartyl-tRNA(Asn)/glutamyl-tRNA(Gln) amidotransferase subunit A
LPVPQWRQNLSGESSVKGLKIGLPKQYFIAGLDPQVAAQVQGMAQQLAAAGAQVVEVDLPHTEYAVAAYYVFAPAEAASNLARYDGLRFGVRVPGATLAETYANSRSAGFGREVQRRIMIGNYVLSSGYYDAYYTQAMRVRQLVAADFTAAFQQVDVILAPTAPSLPFKLGEKAADPVALYLEDAFTIPVSAAGLPALSVPTGTVTNAAGVVLPVGAQLIAPHWQEARLFQVAHAWEHLRGPFTPPFQA